MSKRKLSKHINRNKPDTELFVKNTNTILYQKLLIFLLPFVLYANTLNHDYALDDSIVITQNEFTKKGLSGIKDILTNDTFTGFFGTKKNLVAGGRYRPLSQISFAIEYQIFGLNPTISHFINILFYALTGLLLFVVLMRILPAEKTKSWLLTIPFIATLLFIAHPIHTEVIANIKGRDEIFSLLFSLLSLLFVLNYLDKNKILQLFYAALCFFSGLLSKENTAMFIPVIFLVVLLFTKHPLKKNILSLLPLLLSLSLFLFIRIKVLGAMLSEPSNELMNDPFLLAKTGEKAGTILYTLGQYIKLLFYPHPLTYDYYPFHIQYIKWINIKALWSLILYSCGLIYSTYHVINYLLKKEASKDNFGQRVIIFSILYYLITLFVVSNIVFPVGTFMNERFLYMPSLAFCLLIAWIIINFIPNRFNLKNNVLPIIIFLILLLPYSLKTIDRNKAWENDFVLFTTDVKVSSNSAKSNCSAGGKLLEEAQVINNPKKKKDYLEQSITYLKKSIEIYPTYIDANLLMGNALYENKSGYREVAHYYKNVMLRVPNHPQIILNANIMANGFDSIDHKINFLEELYQYNPNIFEWNYNLGVMYGRDKGNLDKAIKYLEKAMIIRPENSKIHKDLGVAYGFKQEYQKSIKELEKAAEITPDDLQIYYNIAISYNKLGDHEKEKEYLKKAEK